MDLNVSVGDKLFHKYLGMVTVINVNENGIKADTGVRGVLDFNFYDLGKVLYFVSNHSIKLYKTSEEYLKFCEQEKNIKMEIEYKNELNCQRRIVEATLKEMKHTEIKKVINQQDLFDKQISIIEKENLSKTFTLHTLVSEFYPQRETLLKIKKDQEGKIKEIIERRKIEYLVHFTRVENLASILKNGLVPVSIQLNQNIPSVHNDEQRIDSQFDCTSCSVGFPNYKLFYKFKEYKFPETKWAIIVISTDILFTPNNITYYCNTNASGVFSKIRSTKELCTANSFENMFCESIVTKDNKIIHRTTLQISDFATTDPQAEILISDVIDPKHIAGVCFQNQNDIEEYVRKNGINLLNKFNYQVVPAFYARRKDYRFWMKEN